MSRRIYMNRLLTCVITVPLIVMGTTFVHADDRNSDERNHIQVVVSGNDEEHAAAITDAKAEIKKTIKDLVVKAIENEGDIDGAEIETARNEIREALRELKAVTGGGDEDIEELLSDLDLIGDIHIDSDTSIGELAVGALAVTFIFGTPVLIVAGVLYASYRKRKLVYQTMNRMIGEGKEIPEQILRDLHRETTPKSNLHKGLIWSGIGLGILTCFAAMGAESAAFLGLIPLFVGLAQLLIWKLDKGANGKQVS